MSKLLRLPGLIDIHVHLRDPGQTHKEDFYTGTSAALAGGVTTVFDMPNNLMPIFTYEKLIKKIKIAKEKAVCNWGLYFGTNGKNLDEFEKVKDLVVGLKVYLNLTTGKLLIADDELVEDVFEAWPKDKIIIVHAEGEKVDLAIDLCQKYKNKIHITHVSSRNDLAKIIIAKNEGLNITCDTTPNYLFLSQDQISGQDALRVAAKSDPGSLLRELDPGSKDDSPDGEENSAKNFYSVKPQLATKQDQEFLWQNLKYIDCIATDHAPHTIEEKQSADPPRGMPGVETLLPLLLTAYKEGKLTIDDIVRLTNINPQKLFGYIQDKNTYTEVDIGEKYTIKNENLFTKCSWSPFSGWEVYGKVERVFIRGTKVFEDGKVLADPGFGRNVV